MALVIREGDVDMGAIRQKCDPSDVEDALADIDGALAKLGKLNEGMPEGHSHELIRALRLVRDSLSDALDEDPR